jgi:hypothetical protein
MDADKFDRLIRPVEGRYLPAFAWRGTVRYDQTMRGILIVDYRIELAVGEKSGQSVARIVSIQRVKLDPRL